MTYDSMTLIFVHNCHKYLIFNQPYKSDFKLYFSGHFQKVLVGHISCNGGKPLRIGFRYYSPCEIVSRHEHLKHLLVQACLRAPLVVADEVKLAIVFTYFFLFFFLLSTPSAFHPLRGISRA